MKDVYRELSLYINAMNAKRRLLLFKGEDESIFLKEWINGKKASDIGERAFVDETIREMTKNCTKCKNVHDKKLGHGSGDNGIMIILNISKSISNVERRIQDSESTDLLKRMIKAIDIDIDNCYTTNLIKCESRDSLMRPSLMFKNCNHILRREIQEVNPKVVIVMGDDNPLKKMVNEYNTISWHQIEHPLTLLKKPELKKSAWETLKAVMIELKSFS